MELSVFGDDYFMKKALTEARRAFDEDEIPVGAIVVCDSMPGGKQGKLIIGTGYNQVEKLKDVTAHAEIIAITAACNYLGAKYLEDCSMYVTLEPCIMCAAAIQMAHIPRLYFGASDPKKGYRLFTPSIFPAKTVVKKEILEPECAALLNDFFKKLRKMDK
jgi:tRNA(adenine34) deaminase